MRAKLKIGLLIYENPVTSWEYGLVKEIRNSEYSTIKAAILRDKPPATRQNNLIGNSVFRFHKRIDQLIFLRKGSLTERKNILELTGDAAQIILDSDGKSASSGNNSDALAEIRDLDLDVIIKLGFGPVDESLSGLSRYGLWSYPMTDCISESADTTGYYEVIGRRPLIVSELVARMKKDPNPLVLTRVTEATCAYSLSLTREKLSRRASLFAPRILRGLWQEGPDYLQKIRNRFEGNGFSTITQLPPPSTLKSLGNFLKAGLIFIQQVSKKIFYTDPFTWILLYGKGNDNDFKANAYKDFHKLKPARDRFWADPFVVSRAEKYYVFVEEFLYRTNKGHIAVLELDKNGQVLKTQKIIENNYHMSYPFIFERDNTFYIIPETGANRSVDLYKCTEFPGKWEFVFSIMKDINAVDSTLFNYDGKWWLFTLIDKIDSSLAVSPELYLFWSDDFMSDQWTGHPMNPVVTDVRFARPAGRIFIRDGKIYRPSQDCAGRYGNSFDISQILTLTCEDYEEKSVIKVRPDWDKTLKGTHTFNYYDGFTILDVYKYRRRFI